MHIAHLYMYTLGVVNGLSLGLLVGVVWCGVLAEKERERESEGGAGGVGGRMIARELL